MAHRDVLPCFVEADAVGSLKMDSPQDEDRGDEQDEQGGQGAQAAAPGQVEALSGESGQRHHGHGTQSE